MIMIAVQDLDVDTRLGHSSRELAELSRAILAQSLDDDAAFRYHANACGLERTPRRGAVGDEEVCDSLAVDDPRTAALDAHARPA